MSDTSKVAGHTVCVAKMERNDVLANSKSPTPHRDSAAPRGLRFTLEPVSQSTTVNPTIHEDPLLQILDRSRSFSDHYTVSLPTANKTLCSSLAIGMQPIRGVKRPRQQTRSHNPTSHLESQYQPIQNQLSSTPVPSRTIDTIARPGRGDVQPDAPQKSGFSSSILMTGARNLQRNLKDEDENDQDELACHADNIMRMAVDSTMLASSFDTSYSYTFANDLCLDHNNFLNILNEEYESDRSVLEARSGRRRGTLAKTKAKRVEISADELAAAIS